MKQILAALLLLSGIPATGSPAGFANKGYLPPIPIVFSETPLADAIDFLEARSTELDNRESNPSLKGIRFFLDRESLHRDNLEKTVSLNREMADFEDILIAVCEQTGTAYVVSGSIVIITSITIAAEFQPVNHERRDPRSIDALAEEQWRLTRRGTQARPALSPL